MSWNHLGQAEPLRPRTSNKLTQNTKYSKDDTICTMPISNKIQHYQQLLL